MTEPNNTPTPPPTEWEEEFEKLMPKRADEPMSYPQFCAVRDFIRTLLAEQKARMVEEVEGFKGEDFTTDELVDSIIKALSK